MCNLHNFENGGIMVYILAIHCHYKTIKPGGEYLYEHPVTDDQWKKDEILAAKIKKFLSVSLTVGETSISMHCILYYHNVSLLQKYCMTG